MDSGCYNTYFKSYATQMKLAVTTKLNPWKIVYMVTPSFKIKRRRVEWIHFIMWKSWKKRVYYIVDKKLCLTVEDDMVDVNQKEWMCLQARTDKEECELFLLKHFTPKWKKWEEDVDDESIEESDDEGDDTPVSSVDDDDF